MKIAVLDSAGHAQEPIVPVRRRVCHGKHRIAPDQLRRRTQIRGPRADGIVAALYRPIAIAEPGIGEKYRLLNDARHAGISSDRELQRRGSEQRVGNTSDERNRQGRPSRVRIGERSPQILRQHILECGSWFHNFPPSIFPVVEKEFESRKIPIRLLSTRFKDAWMSKTQIEIENDDYYWKKRFSMQTYTWAHAREKHKNDGAYFQKSDYEICPKRNFRKPKDILEKINLFEKVSSIDPFQMPSLRESFLNSLKIKPQRSFLETLKHFFE